MREHPGDLRIQRNGMHALYNLTYDANYDAHERGDMAVRAGENEAYKNAASRLAYKNIASRLDQVEDLECGIPLNGVVKVLLRIRFTGRTPRRNACEHATSAQGDV